MGAVHGTYAQARRKLGDVGDHPKLVEEVNRLHFMRNGLRAKQVRIPLHALILWTFTWLPAALQRQSITGPLLQLFYCP